MGIFSLKHFRQGRFHALFHQSWRYHLHRTRSEYTITPLGKSLLPIIDAMLKWGQEHIDLFYTKYGKSLKQ